MSTELSRRNFLAGAATLSALAGAAALVGCGSSTTAADAGAAEATAADATAWLGAARGIAEFADEQTADVVGKDKVMRSSRKRKRASLAA